MANKQKVTGSIPGETQKFALEGLKVLSLKLPKIETNQQSAYSITWKKTCTLVKWLGLVALFPII